MYFRNPSFAFVGLIARELHVTNNFFPFEDIGASSSSIPCHNSTNLDPSSSFPIYSPTNTHLPVDLGSLRRTSYSTTTLTRQRGDIQGSAQVAPRLRFLDVQVSGLPHVCRYGGGDSLCMTTVVPLFCRSGDLRARNPYFVRDPAN